jgi:phosphatidylglycerol:prolipoprotein diacylglycerol transferase
MYRELLHIWGPFSINSFGLFVALGLALFTFLLYRHPQRKQYLTDEQLFNGLYIGIIATLLGGRLLYSMQNAEAFTNIWDVFALWQGGLSILGGIISCILAIVAYLAWLRIPVILVLDIAALYAPLAQAFGRIGCFCAGCCHGMVCNSWYGITYTDPASFAPLYTPLHPTQLYSAGLFFLLFGILAFLSRRHAAPGMIVTTYLVLSSCERFVVDFWRADREFIGHTFFDILSLHQWIALSIALISLCIYTIHRTIQRPLTNHEPV